jgi:hypothetical protein
MSLNPDVVLSLQLCIVLALAPGLGRISLLDCRTAACTLEATHSGGDLIDVFYLLFQGSPHACACTARGRVVVEHTDALNSSICRDTRYFVELALGAITGVISKAPRMVTVHEKASGPPIPIPRQ